MLFLLHCVLPPPCTQELLVQSKSMLDVIGKHAGAQHEEAVRELERLLVEKAILDNPKILTDAALQKMIVEHPGSENIPAKLAQLAAILEKIKSVAKADPDLFLQLDADKTNAARELKGRAKTMVGTRYVLQNLIVNPPAEASDVPACVESIRAKLKAKNVSVPKFLEDAMQRLMGKT